MGKVKCKKCNLVLESLSVHDFKMCSCENKTFVDGGTDYLRLGGVNLNLIDVWDEGKNKWVKQKDPYKYRRIKECINQFFQKIKKIK